MIFFELIIFCRCPPKRADFQPSRLELQWKCKNPDIQISFLPQKTISLSRAILD
jgi:hypothetical protein